MEEAGEKGLKVKIVVFTHLIASECLYTLASSKQRCLHIVSGYPDRLHISGSGLYVTYYYSEQQIVKTQRKIVMVVNRAAVIVILSQPRDLH